MNWNDENIPDQSGRTVIVTGANTGIGFTAARALAQKGAHVILACRSEEKGNAALNAIREQVPEADLLFLRLDLADLDQVREFVAAFARDHQQLDLLINNAGVMMCPESKTAQGFEMQLGVNHFGHFALTGLLLGLLRKTPGARIVNVSSYGHKAGKMDFDDLQFEKRGYNSMNAYGQSKLANLLFTSELQRRLEAEGSTCLAVAAHPGWTQTDLQRHASIFRWMNPFFAMAPDMGCLPTLRAATDPEVAGNDYFGPKGIMEMRGHPKRVGRSKRAQSVEDAARLWELSEELTGVTYLSAEEAA